MIFLEKMKCLLCELNCSTEKIIKKHYVDYHQIKENNPFFKDLFLPDTLEKKCKFCYVIFKTCRQKKIHMFFFHYSKKEQFGGRQSTLPINILKCGPFTYYTINFNQHKNFYDFFTSEIVDDFLQSVYEVYQPQENKIQAFFEIINQQRGELLTLEDNRAWLINSFNTKHLNTFVRGEIKTKLLKE